MRGLCGVNCNDCSFKDYCKGCSMCEASICQKYCCYCEALCPNRYNNRSYSDRLLNTLSLDLKLSPNKGIELPSFIPGISDKLNGKIEVPLVALDADTFLNSSGRDINKRFLDKGINNALGLEENTNTILHFYIKDKKLNGFWNNRKDIYPKIKKLNLYGIISLNFSVYEDAPRIDHLYNIRKNISTYNEMIESGLAVGLKKS